MATKLRTFDFDRQSEITTTEKVSYPWEQWFDGDIWQIAQGEDFNTHPLMMERIIRTRATGRRAKIKLRHVPVNGDQFGVIVFKRTDIEGPQEQKRAEQAAARKAKREARHTKPEPPAKKAAAKRSTSKAPAKKATASKRAPAKLVAV